MTKYFSETITGTPNQDILFGDTSRNLTNDDKGGKDRILGEGGDDRLYGDANFMYKSSKGGNDFLSDGEGNDALYGDAENMYKSSRGGNDSLNGGAEDDALFGNAFSINESASGGNDSLSGGAGNDFLYGDANLVMSATSQGGKDILTGVDPNVTNPGFGEVDELIGGKNSDRFVLGDASYVYYLGQGDSDYARINDFNLTEGDVIQLKGSLSDYILGVSEGNTTISFNQENPNLVGIVQGIDLTSQPQGAFVFV